MPEPEPKTTEALVRSDATPTGGPEVPGETFGPSEGMRTDLAGTVAVDGEGDAATIARASVQADRGTTRADGPAETIAIDPTEPADPVATTAATLGHDPAETVAVSSRAGSPDLTETFAAGASTVEQTAGLEDGRAGPSPEGPSTSPSRFRILKRHARGGLGEVYLAHDRELDREVALKEIQEKYADRSESRTRFLVEAQITGSLDHPGIVPVYSLSRDVDGRPFYAMRFIHGESMEQAIRAFHASRRKDKSDHGLVFRQLLRRFVEVCNTIAFAHSRGVIHRDIKPANVMLGPYGETLVVDWGLAKRLGVAEGPGTSGGAPGGSGSLMATAETQPGLAMGTPAYMSPEQAAGAPDRLGPASDVYSLGATLYVLLTGLSPFAHGSLREVLQGVQKGAFPRPREIEPGVLPALEAVCLKAMALRPEDRYASAKDLAEDIEHWMADEPIAAYPEPWSDRLARWERRHRTWTRAGAAAMLVVAIVAVVAALLIAAARRNEQAARLRVDAARKGREDHLRALRAQGEDGLIRVQDALDGRDWRAARLESARVLAMAGPEPDLADLAGRADRMRVVADRELAAEDDRREIRATYDHFQALRDDALYHGTLATGLDLAANLDATRTAARAALALYGMDVVSSTNPIIPESWLNPPEKEEIRDGCFELLLLLADSVGLSAPGRPAADPRDRARRALGVLDRASDLGEGTRSYHAARARYLEQLGDQGGAREASARAESAAPTRAVDWFLIGEQLYHRGVLDRAERSFEAALRARPDHFWAQYFLAVCHLKADPQRPAEARAHLTACLSRRPDFPWVYLLRGYALGELGEVAEADADFRRALELSRDDGVRYGVLVNRGGMRVRQGKPEAAIADLTEAIRLRPDQYQAYANLGLARAALRQWDPALEDLGRAIERAPEQAVLRRNRAMIHLGREDFDSALRDLDQAVRLAAGPGPSLADDQARRGRILLRRKQYEEALAAFDAALRFRPDDRDLARLRAEALVSLGRGREAIAAYDRSLEPDSADPDAYRRRGFERAKAADPAGAIADYTRALSLDPNSATTHARRGWAYLGESSKLALRDFDEAIKLHPEDADLYNGRGCARVLLGDYRGAVADAEEALRRDGAQLDPRARISLGYNAACIYAQAAARAAFAAEVDRRQALAREYQDRAVALIRQTLDRLPAAARAPFLKQAEADPALGPIRNEPPLRSP